MKELLFCLLLVCALGVTGASVLSRVQVEKDQQLAEEMLASAQLLEPRVSVDARNKSVKCSSITAYFNGVFQQKENYPQKIAAQFQLKIKVNQAAKQMEFTVDQWNDTLTSSRYVYFPYDYGGEIDQIFCSVGKTCTGPISTITSDSYIRIYHNFGTEILYFKEFKDSFQLWTTQPGTCTKEQPVSPIKDKNADPSLYEYCVCCGDYVNDGGLYCPVNPWAK